MCVTRMTPICSAVRECTCDDILFKKHTPLFFAKLMEIQYALWICIRIRILLLRLDRDYIRYKKIESNMVIFNLSFPFFPFSRFKL